MHDLILLLACFASTFHGRRIVLAESPRQSPHGGGNANGVRRSPWRTKEGKLRLLGSTGGGEAAAAFIPAAPLMGKTIFAKSSGQPAIVTVVASAAVRQSNAVTYDDSRGQQKLSTERKPLSEVFDGERKYLLSMKQNVRSYEWGVDEAETLLNDLSSNPDFGGEIAEDEFELNSFILVRGEKVPRQGQYYDVHDGQQRIITFALILAAMRDRFLQLDNTEMAEELHKKLVLTKPRWDKVLRVQLRTRDSGMFNQIIDRNMSSKTVDGLPPKSEWSKMGEVDRHVVENFETIRKDVNKRDSDMLGTLFDYMMERCFVLLSEAPSPKMARSLVMGQNRGKNVEPIDEFKGQLIFRGIEDEVQQDHYLEVWDGLVKEHGRRSVQEACVLSAEADLRKLRKRNLEMDLLEAWIKKWMQPYKGATFFKNRVRPAVEQYALWQGGTLIVDGAGTRVPSHEFLRLATKVPTTAELAMVVLAMRTCKRNDLLWQLERVALWMLLARPTKTERQKRCFDILQVVENAADCDSSSLDLSEEERSIVLAALNGEFQRSGDVDRAKAILWRLNEHVLRKENDASVQQTQLTLEHVLPQQPSEGWKREWPNHVEYCHRLGNLALLNRKKNSKLSNGVFADKKETLSTSVYPLTAEIAKNTKWTAKEVNAQQDRYIKLAKIVWEL